jgi:hypothetical protein
MRLRGSGVVEMREIPYPDLNRNPRRNIKKNTEYHEVNKTKA